MNNTFLKLIIKGQTKIKIGNEQRDNNIEKKGIWQNILDLKLHSRIQISLHISVLTKVKNKKK